MSGRSTSGFHQPGRHCLHQARSAVRCSASRMYQQHFISSVLGGGVIISCMAVVLRVIHPRTPTLPGRSTSGFHRPVRRCLHQARSTSLFLGEGGTGNAWLIYTLCCHVSTTSYADCLSYSRSLHPNGTQLYSVSRSIGLQPNAFQTPTRVKYSSSGTLGSPPDLRC